MKSAIDPVCNESVSTWWAIIRGLYADVRRQRYYFCSSDCHKRFIDHPAVYTMAEDQLRASDDGMTQLTDTPLDHL